MFSESDGDWSNFDDTFNNMKLPTTTTTTTITTTTTTKTTTVHCPWPPCYSNSWNVDFASIPLMNKTEPKNFTEQKVTTTKSPQDFVVVSEQNNNNNSECNTKTVIIKERTSSALIIMGIFFTVVVIGLFWYLPKWKPRFGRKSHSGSTVPSEISKIFD